MNNIYNLKIAVQVCGKKLLLESIEFNGCREWRQPLLHVMIK